MVRRPVLGAGHCQDTAEAGQYQGKVAECQVSIRILEPTLQRRLEMGAHKEVTTLAE